MNDIHLELELARNDYGQLSWELKKKLIDLFDEPTVEKWDQAYAIVLFPDPTTTLWQAVGVVDPTFPKEGRATDLQGRIVEEWSRVPDRALIYRALRFATH